MEKRKRVEAIDQVIWTTLFSNAQNVRSMATFRDGVRKKHVT